MSYRFCMFSCLLILRASANNSTSVDQPISKTARFNLMVTTLKEIINSNSKVYAFQDIPPSNHTTITCSVHINNITSVNIKTQTFSLDLMLNSAWHDPRLIHPNFTEEFAIPSTYNKKVWLPDVGFSNSIAGAVTRITDESLFSVMIGPGGIRMTSRLNVELACDMQFEYYPMDTQICEVQLQSWKYPIKELTLNWASNRAMTYSQEADRALPQYNVYINTTKSWLRKLNIRQDYKCVETYDTSGRGSYSCLEISFIFRRNIEFYAYDIYIPLLLIVLISFIGLFIDFNVMPARIGVGSLSISATTNIGRALRVNTPPVSYTKAADVWLWTCLIFVYAAFMELGVVNVFNRKFRFDKATAGTSFFKRSPPAKVVDKVARIFFPSAFVLFNIIYWSYYLTVSQYNWNHIDLIRKIFKENEVLYQNTTIEG